VIQTPLVVLVHDGRYDCFSLNPRPTIRDKWLMALIDVMNGISEDVADGRYYFNAEEQEGTDVKVKLFPADGTALE
jgi:hypothetical protein